VAVQTAGTAHAALAASCGMIRGPDGRIVPRGVYRAISLRAGRPFDCPSHSLVASFELAAPCGRRRCCCSRVRRFASCGRARPAAGCDRTRFRSAPRLANTGRRVRTSMIFGDTLDIAGPPPRRIVSAQSGHHRDAVRDGRRGTGRRRTQWDSYPPAALAVPDLGDGLRPNVEAVLATHPNLVVLYAAADNRDAVHRFRAAGIATLSVRDDRMVDFRRVSG